MATMASCLASGSCSSSWEETAPFATMEASQGRRRQPHGYPAKGGIVWSAILVFRKRLGMRGVTSGSATAHADSHSLSQMPALDLAS